jgi:glycosidase
MAAGETEADLNAAAKKNGRDNARTPMQWDASAMSAFSEGQPWIDVNPNYTKINVANDRAQPDGIFQFYQDLIALRRKNATIQEGSYTPIEAENPKVFAYMRHLDGQKIYVFANFTDKGVTIANSVGLLEDAETLLSNMDSPIEISEQLRLKPYQAIALRPPH